MPQTRLLSIGVCSVLAVLCAGASAQILPSEFRNVDGTNNNLSNVDWGAVGVELVRNTTLDYGDGIGSPAGATRASPREISNIVVAQPGDLPNSAGATSMIWQWGQFLDHDFDLSGGANPAEPFDIMVPLGDPFFDPFNTGTEVIPFSRSLYSTLSGVRQQLNEITAFIDGSNVYGSDMPRATELRRFNGTGKLKTIPGNMPPFNVNGFPNAPDTSSAFFLCGDVRANEQVGLTAMHTLFVREHNFWAGMFAGLGYTEDEIYEFARIIVGAELQVITYNEFLPVLLGPNALTPYAGYNPSVDPGISNAFSTAAYRVGHTMLNSMLLRLKKNAAPIPGGPLPLQSAFFNPSVISSNGGIGPILHGLVKQAAQEVDSYIVDDVRNFLFGPPGSGGLDLASLNIQRGRDHGLASYNQTRVDMGLPAVTTFTEISSDPVVQANLAAAYATVDDIDLWVGGLAEDHVSGALVGETFFAILKDQFERVRDGDRFWYENYLSGPLQFLVKFSTLKDIIVRNTDVPGGQLQSNVFLLP